MSDYLARKQLKHEIEVYIKTHPGCTMTDMVKRLYPKFGKAFPNTIRPIDCVRRACTQHVSKLVRRGDVIVGRHEVKTVKTKPMRTFTWREDNGSNESSQDADKEING